MREAKKIDQSFRLGSAPENEQKKHEFISKQDALIQELVDDHELSDLNPDKMLAKMQIEWLQKLKPETKDFVEKKINLDFIKKAIFSYDYKELVLLILVLNQLAKDFYTIRPFSARAELSGSDEEIEEFNRIVEGLSTEIYKIKEIVLAKACQLASFQAPEYSYGLKPERGTQILYFDLPGYGQFSFHLPNMYEHMSDSAELFRSIDIPRYHGDWHQRYRLGKTRMYTSKAKEIVEHGEHSLSLDQVRKYLKQSKSVDPKKAHDIYFRAMSHSDFEKNKDEVSELIFKHAPTIPEALSGAYVSGFDLPQSYRDFSTVQREPWMDRVGPYFSDLRLFIKELEALVDYTTKDRYAGGVYNEKEGEFYLPEEVEEQELQVKAEMDDIKKQVNDYLVPAVLFYLENDRYYYAPDRERLYEDLEIFLSRLDMKLDDILTSELIMDYERLKKT